MKLADLVFLAHLANLVNGDKMDLEVCLVNEEMMDKTVMMDGMVTQAEMGDLVLQVIEDYRVFRVNLGKPDAKDSRAKEEVAVNLVVKELMGEQVSLVRRVWGVFQVKMGVMAEMVLMAVMDKMGFLVNADSQAHLEEMVCLVVEEHLVLMDARANLVTQENVEEMVLLVMLAGLEHQVKMGFRVVMV